MKRTQTWMAVVAVLTSVSVAVPQEKTEAPAPRKPATPLRVQIVFSKFQGDKKVASLPYTLVCTADDRTWPARLRMGIEVPVAVAAAKDQALQSFQYKNVGTNIDCSARSVEDGRYKLDLSVEQSSVYSRESGRTPDGRSEGAATWALGDTPVGMAPLFRTFNTSFSPILRDGQSAQYTVATDPVSGEVVKIDVTMSVVK
jgi:hypothetical protein